MVKTILFIFEICTKDYIFLKKMINQIKSDINNNIINNIIITCVTEYDLPTKIYKDMDRIYKNTSPNKVYQIINKEYIKYDILIHINTSSLIDIKYLFNNIYQLESNSMLVSSDKYNILCRIYKQQNLKKHKINTLSYSRILNKIDYKILDYMINFNPSEDNYRNYIKSTYNMVYSSSIGKNKIVDFGKITVILTCYNSMNTIKYSLFSLINQTYENLEIIIVDDCSTDDTVKIIEEIKNKNNRRKIKIILNEENKGCYYSKNIGLKNIDPGTKYICFHDSDDISKCCRIEKQIYFMKKNKLLISTCLGYNNNNNIKMPMITLMISKNVFETIGYFNLRRYGSDEEYYYRIFISFVKDFDWNNSTLYDESSNYGFFKKYKNYQILKEVLYTIYSQSNSLTKIYDKKLRSKLSQYLINKYKNMNIKNIYHEFENNKTIETDSMENYDYESDYSINNISYSEDNTSNEQPNDIISNNTSNEQPNDIISNNTSNEQPNDIISNNTSNTSNEFGMNIFDVKQVYISKSIDHLQDRFLLKFDLKKYNNNKKPALFFGIYNKEDIDKLDNHKGDIYIIWGGTDIDLDFPIRKSNLKKILYNKIKLHYSISNNISDRLKKLNLPYERININLVDKKLFKKRIEYGNAIFIYNGLNPGNEKIYSNNIYEEVMKKLPNYEYILSNTLNVPYEKMPEIYSRCFVGLRLTINDGNANMVQEMDEMDIPVIHNGDMNTIKWSNVKNIIYNIELLYDKLNIIEKSVEDGIIHHNRQKKVLIIFEKDLNLKDGSYIWFLNILNLFYKNKNNVTIICKKSVDISNLEIIEIDKIDINNHLINNNYDIICYRPGNIIIEFSENIKKKIILFLNFFIKDHIQYYTSFKKIFTNSILIKDELEFNNISPQIIDVIPPLISEIKQKNDTATGSILDNINFIYCGTLKKEYLSLELLELFLDLSKKFIFNLKIIYGKIKESEDEYDRKLKNTIDKLKNQSNVEIYYNLSHSDTLKYMNKSDYGIVIHNSLWDNKQQSTKLIEYLSQGCIPIKSLNYLNCGYYSNEKDLTFENIKELNNILTSILKKEIRCNSFSVDNSKLKNHLYSRNLSKIYHCLNHTDENQILIKTSNLDKFINNKILISNNLENRHFSDIMIYIDSEPDITIKHAKIISKFILLDDVKLGKKEKLLVNKKIKLLIFNRNIFGFFKDKSIYDYYDIVVDTRIFDYQYDKNMVYLSGSTCVLDKYVIPNCNYIYFNIKLKKNFYFIEFNIKSTDSEGYLLFNVLDYVKGVYQDINRNLHVIQKKENKIIFTVKIFKEDDYQFRIKSSGRNKKPMSFYINKLKIHEMTNLNYLCNSIKIINMDKDINNFNNIKRLFENNYIISSRTEGVNGYSDIIKKQYDIYDQIDLTPFEKSIGRKAIASPGALGYLYSMKNIFREAIINNYEYIMICDDDVAIIHNFIIKFNKLLKSITKPKLLMLGSSQWCWDDLKLNYDFYKPTNTSNGSFCNIYHRSIFEKIYYEIIKYSSPFDCGPMKSIFDDNCFVSYPNLLIAQLENSSIIKKENKNRNYDRFKWNINNYKFSEEINVSNIIYEKINPRINKKLFIIGITTFNRYSYLNDCLKSLLNTLCDNNDYILIIADGCSKDNTLNTIKSFQYNKNVSLIIIQNPNHFIYRQSNSILKYSLNFSFNFGFLMNDDLIFLKKGWDNLYYDTSIKDNISHIVYFGKKTKKEDHYKIHKNNNLESYVTAENCQGAFFTFNRKLIENVGFFDEKNFQIRGHSHIDFTLRCCRYKYNNINTLYDVINSNNYIKLSTTSYISSFSKLPLLLRELHKVDIYELGRRNEIIHDNTRLKIDVIFNMKRIIKEEIIKVL